jgi:hypothetical protein
VERGPARLVVVDAIAVREEGESAGERVEVVPEGVGRAADVPAQAARTRAGEHDARLPAIAQDLRQTVRAPHGHEVHHAAAVEQDHVLAEQVRAHVRHVRLGEQPQEAELDVVAARESCLVADSRRPVRAAAELSDALDTMSESLAT